MIQKRKVETISQHSVTHCYAKSLNPMRIWGIRYFLSSFPSLQPPTNKGEEKQEIDIWGSWERERERIFSAFTTAPVRKKDSRNKWLYDTLRKRHSLSNDPQAPSVTTKRQKAARTKRAKFLGMQVAIARTMISSLLPHTCAPG